MSTPPPTTAFADAPRLGSLGRILRNSGLNLTAVLLGNLVAVLVLVKRLGPEVLGRYYLVFSFIMVTQLVVEAGAATILTNRIAREFSRWRHIAAEAAGLLVVACFASWLALAAVGIVWSVPSGEPELVAVFFAAGAACIGLQLQVFCAGVFRAFERFEYESAAKLLQAFTFVGLLYWLVDGTGDDLFRAVAAFAAGNLLAGALLCACFLWNFGLPGFRLNSVLLKDWLRESIPVGAGDVLRRTTLQIDTILLGAMAPFSAAGIYNLAYRPLGFLRLIPRVILTVLFPSFSQLAQESSAALAAAMARSIRLLWVASLPIAVCVVVCAERLVLLFGNEQYADAALPMRLLIGVVCFSFISTQFRFYLTALGRQAVFTRLAAVVLVLEALAIAALIPAFSYLGACWAVLLGEGLFLVAGFAACWQLGLKCIEWTALFKATVLAASMACVLWPLHRAALSSQVLWCTTAALAYFGGCVAWGVLYRDELNRVFRVCLKRLNAGAAR